MDYENEQCEVEMIFTEPNVSQTRLDQISAEFHHMIMLIQELSQLELQTVHDGTHQRWLRAFVAHYFKCEQIQELLSRNDEFLDRDVMEVYFVDLIRFYSEDYPYSEENVCSEELIEYIDQCNIWQLTIVRVIRSFFES